MGTPLGLPDVSGPQAHTMTLTELKYIVAVARERHFGRAAEACHVSQPTLSVAVKKLEEDLEVKLFERSANEVSVTHLGEEIVRQAQSVLEQATHIREIAKRGKDPLDGPLTLGVRAESLVVDDNSTIRGRADVVERLGERTLAYVTLADGQVVVAEAHRDSMLSAGEHVGLRYDASHVHLFDEAGKAYHAHQ